MGYLHAQGYTTGPGFEFTPQQKLHMLLLTPSKKSIFKLLGKWKTKLDWKSWKKALFFILITTVKVPLSRQPHATIDSVLLESFETERFNNYNKLLSVYQFVLWYQSSTLDYCFRCVFYFHPYIWPTRWSIKIKYSQYPQGGISSVEFWTQLCIWPCP